MDFSRWQLCGCSASAQTTGKSRVARNGGGFNFLSSAWAPCVPKVTMASRQFCLVWILFRTWFSAFYRTPFSNTILIAQGAFCTCWCCHLCMKAALLRISCCSSWRWRIRKESGRIQVSPALNSWVPARQRSSSELWKGSSNTAREYNFSPLTLGDLQHALHCRQRPALLCQCLTVSCTCFFMACVRTDPEYQKPSIHLILESSNPEAISYCYPYFGHLDGFLAALTICSFPKGHFPAS